MRKALDFQTYLKTQTFAALMDNNGGLDSWRNYSGDRMETKLVVVTRTRDSELLAESNFDAALERLGGEGKGVEVVRQNHWGCGWLEHVMVDVSAKAKAKIAFEIHKELADYPVLDDSAYSDLQYERFREFAENHKVELAAALSQYFGVRNGRALVALASDLEVEAQHYGGEDNCINIYNCRAPSEYDVKELKSVMGQLEHSYKRSRTFKALKAAVDAYVVKAA